HLATQLRLHAVQLHGNENHEFIRQLRDELPVNCEVWRAICIESSGTSPCQIVENKILIVIFLTVKRINNVA
ncbi:bifunctional indole-3-glycerol phosphate synthase/phosphoribosylanthranilate isomerase, partial [Pasteurella multocida subsp. multocida str. Anand1_cattle]